MKYPNKIRYCNAPLGITQCCSLTKTNLQGVKFVSWWEWTKCSCIRTKITDFLYQLFLNKEANSLKSASNNLCVFSCYFLYFRAMKKNSRSWENFFIGRAGHMRQLLRQYKTRFKDKTWLSVTLLLNIVSNSILLRGGNISRILALSLCRNVRKLWRAQLWLFEIKQILKSVAMKNTHSWTLVKEKKE